MTLKRRQQLNRWLFSAIRSRRPARVLELLNCGAEANATTLEGESALVCAVEYDLYELIEPLLKRGADPNAHGRFGCALHLIASSSLHVSVELAELLIRNGARLDARDPEGATPMFLAARAGKAALIQLFQRYGADISERNGELDTALTFAACWGYTEQARMLLDYGIDLHARDDLGMNALAWAAKDGHTDTIALLLRHGADPNVADLWGRTPLIRAAQHGSLECVRLLLDAGADPMSKSESGETALDVARRYAGRDLAESMRVEWVSVTAGEGEKLSPISVRRTTKAGGEPSVIVEQRLASGGGRSLELCDGFDAIVELLGGTISPQAAKR